MFHPDTTLLHNPNIIIKTSHRVNMPVQPKSEHGLEGMHINMDDIDKMISESINDENKRSDMEQPAQKRPRLQADNLELDFEKAIEDHQRELTNPPEDRQTPSVGEDSGNAPHDPRHDPRLRGEGAGSEGINAEGDADARPGAAGDATQQLTSALPSRLAELHMHLHADSDAASVVHHGITIPADSELLNTNTAFAAYTALSSSLPPLALVSNAQLAALPLPIVAPDYVSPRIQLLVNALPTLDNLATQLLRMVAVGPYQKVVDLASNPDTAAGAAYRDLASLFELTKRLYSEEDPFLSVEHIAPGMWKEGEPTPNQFRNREQSIESTLRKVNLATFLVATLGTIEVGFFYLNEHFLLVFCPAHGLEVENLMSNMLADNMSLQTGAPGDAGRLLKPQAQLFLDLKTQAYISAAEVGDRSSDAILAEIFPDMEPVLLQWRNSRMLTPVEADFVSRCQARRDTLLRYQGPGLAEEYDWFEFLRDLFEYIGKNVGYVVWGRRRRPPAASGDRERLQPLVHAGSLQHHLDQHPHLQHHPQDAQEYAYSYTADGAPRKPGAVATVPRPEQMGEIDELTRNLLPSEIQEQQIHLRFNPNSTVRNPQRRPWTREEEKALRQALELKGPQWLTILELFGAGGKILEALKNRNQMQLKDKARNWKMFFLKTGMPVPDYLQKVTGDLEREDRSRESKRARGRKTAAAPVPTLK